MQKSIIKKMLTRTKLVKVSGISSSYPSPRKPGERLDMGEIKSSLLAQDASDALHALNLQVRLAGGLLCVTDSYRSWAVQAKAHAEWRSGKKKHFVAPPGESFHMAGRAVDLDLSALNFSGPRHSWLAKLWDIAIPLGWYPIVSEPDASLSESWHWEYPGRDWLKAYKTCPNKLVAKSAIVDAGQWDNAAEPKLLQGMFLQAQLNRVHNAKLQVDGLLGPHTSRALARAGLSNVSIAKAIENLVQQ